MLRVLVTVMFSCATAHKEHQAVCPVGMKPTRFVEALLTCFERTIESNDHSESCIDDGLKVFRELDNGACLKCIEHFVEDHLMDEVTHCPSEFLSSGINRESCVSMIANSIDQHCY